MVEDAKGPSSFPGCLSLCVVHQGHRFRWGAGSKVAGRLASVRPSVGSLAAPRRLPGSTPPQPTLIPQLPPTPDGPVTAIRELGCAECSGPRVVGAPPRHPVWRIHITVHQELWGACVHGRDTQDGCRAPPGQEALETQWEAWDGLLTTTGAWSTSPLCPRLPQLQG